MNFSTNWRRFIAPLSVAGIALVYDSKKQNLRKDTNRNDLNAKCHKASEVIQRFLLQSGAPGISVGVSVNGKCVLAKGFGFSDVEQMVKCNANTVMRIASISKCITATITARLVQSNELELDSSIYKYLPDYPKAKFKDETFDITVRQLLCHTSGIRHYREEDREEIEPDVKTNDKKSSDNNKNNNKNKKDGDTSESVTPEFLSNRSYESVEDALEMFKNDALIAKPGTEFNYSTHGYTLLSAVLEKAAKTPFKEQAKQLFSELGMNHTVVDHNEQIMPNRARYYYRDRHHKLKNVPEVDNSYKWAGGGFLSNVNDLLIFANAMLYSFHHSRNESQVSDDQSLRPLLERDALKTFWEGEVDGKHGFRYGLGWYKKPKTVEYGGGNGWIRNGFWMHTGAAVGASSVLVVKPNFNGSNTDGVCVAILVNLHDCKNVTHLALELAEIFEKH